MAMNPSPGPAAAYPPTRWSLVARAGATDPALRQRALNELLATYCPVLRAFLASGLGFAPEAAEDLVQSFVADKVLQKELLAQARPERGRFRNFLLKAVKNYALSEVRKQQAQKRAPAGGLPPSLDELPELPSAQASQESLYNLEWARQTLSTVLDRMRSECAGKGRLDIWEIFNLRIVQPLLGGGAVLPYETLVQRYGLQSPSQASNVLITGKRMFQRLLEEVVRQTVTTDEEVAAEIRDLKRILSS
jgi:DNA-directed RNA polymerase specialized sigma24 family protein